LCRGCLFVGARALDVILAARAVGRSRPAWTALAHRAEPLAVGTAAAAALAGGAEALCGAAATARLVLVAEPRVALRDALVALGHDLALVDPDLDADPAEGRLRLGEAVIDVGTDRVQRDAALGVHFGPAHLPAAEPATAHHLDAVGAGADG